MAVWVPERVGVIKVGKPYFWISSPSAEKVDRSYHRGMRDVALTPVAELFVAKEASIKESRVAAIKQLFKRDSPTFPNVCVRNKHQRSLWTMYKETESVGEFLSVHDDKGRQG
jgi:hypothetical protein|tara:strand:+ start:204 stop:542 length:339 start_codon:yes stop_codon:yes gene_type:complete